MVLPHSHRIPRVLWYSGYTSPSRRFAYEALTLYGSTFQLYSTTTVRAKQCPYPVLYFYMTVWALSLSLTTTQKIDSFLSLPPGTKMFQFPGFPSYTLCVQVSITQHYLRWVPSFGYPRIKSHLHFPVAFRSLSRPSSAPSAKASTLRSS